MIDEIRITGYSHADDLAALLAELEIHHPVLLGSSTTRQMAEHLNRIARLSNTTETLSEIVDWPRHRAIDYRSRRLKLRIASSSATVA